MSRKIVKNRNLIKTVKWVPTFKRELPLLMVYIANEGYVKKWLFKNVLFVVKEGIQQSFRSENDFKLINKFFSKIKDKGGFLKRIYEDITDYGNLWKKLSNRTKRQNLQNKNNEDLLDIFLGLYGAEKKLNSVLQIPAYFEKTLGNISGKKIIKLLKKASEARGKAAGMFYKIYGEDYTGFFHEFGRKFEIEADLVRYLLPEEIIKSLKKNQLAISENSLKQRFKLSVLVTINRKTRLLTGQGAKLFIKKNLLESSESAVGIKGTVAYPGKVSGQAKIVIGKSDFFKIEKGDILVAPTTGVHYVPYLKKVAAIVTDEGGLTCHASLISRELKIPSVVGTKIATRVLKDGDLVEVDANKGIVKILKKAK